MIFSGFCPILNLQGCKRKKYNVHWKGWKKQSPNHSQRITICKKCGKKCFLGNISVFLFVIKIHVKEIKKESGPLILEHDNIVIKINLIRELQLRQEICYK